MLKDQGCERHRRGNRLSNQGTEDRFGVMDLASSIDSPLKNRHNPMVSSFVRQIRRVHHWKEASS
jgi:hypothetical protein